MKKENSKFDISIGSYDGAECSELVGLYLLNRMIYEEQIFTIDEVVLYRDDMLTMSEGRGQTMDKKRKAMISIFKEEGLTVTCKTNLDRVQFLDVLFDLKDNSYKPYHKMNSKVQYVSKWSNHPRVVLDNIPIGINQRLANISSDENAFNSEKSIFQEALKNAGYNHELDHKCQRRKKNVRHVRTVT